MDNIGRRSLHRVLHILVPLDEWQICKPISRYIFINRTIKESGCWRFVKHAVAITYLPTNSFKAQTLSRYYRISTKNNLQPVPNFDIGFISYKLKYLQCICQSTTTIEMSTFHCEPAEKLTLPALHVHLQENRRRSCRAIYHTLSFMYKTCLFMKHVYYETCLPRNM